MDDSQPIEGEDLPEETQMGEVSISPISPSIAMLLQMPPNSKKILWGDLSMDEEELVDFLVLKTGEAGGDGNNSTRDPTTQVLFDDP